MRRSRGFCKVNDTLRPTRRMTFAIGLALVAALGAQAQQTAPPAASEGPQPLLWRVRSESATVYLYGSIHAAPPEALPPPMAAREAFARSQTLVTEVALVPGLELDIGRAMQARSEMPDGTQLRELFTDDEWGVVRRSLAGSGIPRAELLDVQPWVVELLIAELMGLPDGFTTESGLDVYFAGKAQARGVEMLGIETVEEQIDALAGGSLEEQAASLVATIERSDDALGIDELYEAWYAGDAETLGRLVREHYSPPEFAGTFRRLFTERNERWVEALIDYLSTESAYFIVVGAGHLVGDGSVIDLLEQAGYPSVRIRTPDDL